MDEENLQTKFLAMQAQERIDRMEKILARISRNDDIVELDENNFSEFSQQKGERLIFFLDSPLKRTEAVDLAVLIPDLSKLTNKKTASGFLREEAARKFMAKFAIDKLPAILFMRDGGYVGVITGLKNWGEYHTLISEMMATPVSTMPKTTIAISPI